MLACRKCGNCDDSKLRIEKHLFKNGTIHVKLLCYECGWGEWIPKSSEALFVSKKRPLVTNHSGKARKEREREFRSIRKRNRKSLQYVQNRIQLGLDL